MSIQTYGVVPQPVYPESLHSSLSGPINSLLKTRLREHALILRDLTHSLREQGVSAASAQATLRAKKEELLSEVYNVMTATLGVPPLPDSTFTWDYYDKDGKPHTWEGTPKQFYKVCALTGSLSHCIRIAVDTRRVGLHQQDIPCCRLLLASSRPTQRVQEALHSR